MPGSGSIRPSCSCFRSTTQPASLPHDEHLAAAILLGGQGNVDKTQLQQRPCLHRWWACTVASMLYQLGLARISATFNAVPQSAIA